MVEPHRSEDSPASADHVWSIARLRSRLRVFSDDMLIGGFVLIVLIGFMLPSMIVTIPAGHLGVLWKRFGGGTVLNSVITEGTQLIFPWDQIFIYDARLQNVDREFEVLASDGLKIKLDLAWRYRIIPTSLAQLHKYAGPEYPETLLAPTVGARARDVIAIYRPEDIYTDHRLEIQNQISRSVRYDLQSRFNAEGEKEREWVLIEDVLIKRILLPEGVQESIVRKNMAKHEVEEYALIVDKEKQETERKRVEALGIRNFQEIVSTGMTDAYLRWRGIEATVELARSNNAKIVVIGDSKTGGLPIISINSDTLKSEAPKSDASTQSSLKHSLSSEATKIGTNVDKAREARANASAGVRPSSDAKPSEPPSKSDKAPSTSGKPGAR